jgi:uncharacterized protein YndB with AHSA1/START domain
MRWILIAVATIAAAVAVAALVGWRLPRSHRASRDQVMAANPELIWAAITDVEAFPSWRTDVKTVRRLPDRDGRRSWVEDGGSGKITFVVERADAPRLLVTRIADPDLPFGGTWTYEITPAAQGSRLTITEDGEIYNPFFRFMARFIFGYEATIASYLAALEARLDLSARRAR